MQEESNPYSLLEELGLTKTEAIIYLALVKKGKMTAYRLSKETNLYKANTYAALDSLVRKGLATKKDISGKNTFEAKPPEEILSNLDRQKEKLQAAIPLIERHFDEDYEEVSVFSGLQNLFNIFYKLLEQKKPIYVFDIPSFVPDLVRIHINQFHKERIKKKVAMYHIYDYDARERIKFLTKMKHTYARQGKENRHSLVSTLVCGNTSLLINWKKDIKTVKIVDSDVAETYRNQFELLWKEK